MDVARRTPCPSRSRHSVGPGLSSSDGFAQATWRAKRCQSNSASCAKDGFGRSLMSASTAASVCSSLPTLQGHNIQSSVMSRTSPTLSATRLAHAMLPSKSDNASRSDGFAQGKTSCADMFLELTAQQIQGRQVRKHQHSHSRRTDGSPTRTSDEGTDSGNLDALLTHISSGSLPPVFARSLSAPNHDATKKWFEKPQSPRPVSSRAAVASASSRSASPSTHSKCPDHLLQVFSLSYWTQQQMENVEIRPMTGPSPPPIKENATWNPRDFEMFGGSDWDQAEYSQSSRLRFGMTPVFVDRLAEMAKARGLSLQDAEQDLQIIRLTLQSRNARRRWVDYAMWRSWVKTQTVAGHEGTMEIISNSSNEASKSKKGFDGYGDILGEGRLHGGSRGAAACRTRNDQDARETFSRGAADKAAMCDDVVREGSDTDNRKTRSGDVDHAAKQGGGENENDEPTPSGTEQDENAADGSKPGFATGRGDSAQGGAAPDVPEAATAGQEKRDKAADDEFAFRFRRERGSDSATNEVPCETGLSGAKLDENFDGESEGELSANVSELSHEAPQGVEAVEEPEKPRRLYIPKQREPTLAEKWRVTIKESFDSAGREVISSTSPGGRSVGLISRSSSFDFGLRGVEDSENSGSHNIEKKAALFQRHLDAKADSVICQSGSRDLWKKRLTTCQTSVQHAAESLLVVGPKKARQSFPSSRFRDSG